MKKDSIPTIIYKPTSTGLQKFEIKYSETTNCYDENDFTLVNSIRVNQEDKKSILKRKQDRISELKSLCRFCMCSQSDESKLVQIVKLETYSININELMQLLGLNIENQELFSDIVCEQCFQLIVDIDNFKKKCKEIQQEILDELQTFDRKVMELSNSKEFVDDDVFCDETELIIEDINQTMDTSLEIIEEHLVDDNEEFIEQEFELGEEIPLDQIEYIEEIPFNDEQQLKSEDTTIDQEIVVSVTPVQLNQKSLNYSIELDKSKENSIQGVDEYEDVSVDDIIKNPERNRFCFKIFECFFCKMKFAGKKTYVAHKCAVSEVKCEKCDKTFNKVHLYNSHISNFHHELPISQHYCPICKTVLITTLNQFKVHRRNCNKQTNNQPIECEICHKVCNNLKGYTIHKLFHDTRNYTTSSGEKIATSGLNVFPGSAVCELCGKEFQSMVGYRMHKRNVHRIGSEGEIFQCHVCSKICPTRRSLFDHMRNTHRIQETPCQICHKVFRTKILLSKHMIYHDETKRVFKCNLCPDKSFFTKVALKRHQNSHLGKKDYHCSECSSSFTTNHQVRHIFTFIIYYCFLFKLNFVNF